MHLRFLIHQNVIKVFLHSRIYRKSFRTYHMKTGDLLLKSLILYLHILSSPKDLNVLQVQAKFEGFVISYHNQSRIRNSLFTKQRSLKNSTFLKIDGCRKSFNTVFLQFPVKFTLINRNFCISFISAACCLVRSRFFALTSVLQSLFL